ncbi:hypothetical protein GOBAR_AA12658 [Gossypium barbadense]|uniref:HIT domain-containing protein n=1 Tax=Gossypium barbadense TaxID=3634 RepID=A0A2P5XX99_GOSBA|nr:hypothetical protein GOBAR_AA12658 [Gossypium barbadense]
MARAISPCIFCQIAGSSNSTPLLHSVRSLDDKVVAFKDINPSAFRHYLVVPVEHIPTVNDLQRRNEDYTLGKVPFGKSYDKCGGNAVTPRCTSAKSIQLGGKGADVALCEENDGEEYQEC